MQLLFLQAKTFQHILISAKKTKKSYKQFLEE